MTQCKHKDVDKIYSRTRQKPVYYCNDCNEWIDKPKNFKLKQ